MSFGVSALLLVVHPVVMSSRYVNPACESGYRRGLVLPRFDFLTPPTVPGFKL